MASRKNRQGVRTLSARDDLSQLFDPERESAAEPEEDFAELLETSLAAQDRAALLRAKEAASSQRPPSVRQRIESYPPPQQELDLHRLTADEACLRTEHFLESAQTQGLRTVRIIVGKGVHSRGSAVLPDVIEQNLAARKKAGQVLTFVWEKREKARSGSIIVYLPKRGQ